MQLSIIVPTFNESENVAELVRRITEAVAHDAHLSHETTEVIFVDDSTDDTPEQIRTVAKHTPIRVICHHREVATAGLGGAVLEGVRIATSDLCLIMDGDLQHPPEKIGELTAKLRETGADIVVASRYLVGGDADGLSGSLRHGVSRLSTGLAKLLFPSRLRGCSDPMTGFFMFDRRRVDLDGLRPMGFKILLEVLARSRLRIAEIPFEFAGRHSGVSKANVRQGVRFLRQLITLRLTPKR